jgi:hypothetical protein
MYVWLFVKDEVSFFIAHYKWILFRQIESPLLVSCDSSNEFESGSKIALLPETTPKPIDFVLIFPANISYRLVSCCVCARPAPIMTR